jgi:PPOX class probable F420-dependent enzyme
MTDPTTPPLAHERYINLETFKKDGTGVKTPVWVAALDGKLVIVTGGDSFKVKRIRNNEKVRAAPCDARGKLRGAWVEGTAKIVDDPAFVVRAHAALRKKYGIQFMLLDLGAAISGRIKGRAYLEVTPRVSA